MMINSNNLPKFDNMDIATKKRVCIIPCKKQWTNDPDVSLNEVDCMGNNYKKQIRRDPEQAKMLLKQEGLDALFTLL